MMNWKPVDWIVAMFTAVVALVFVSSIGLQAFRGIEMSDGKAEMLNGLLASIISIISMYVGAQIQKNRDTK